MDEVMVTIPPGSPEEADVTITSSAGTSTLTKGFNYLSVFGLLLVGHSYVCALRSATTLGVPQRGRPHRCFLRRHESVLNANCPAVGFRCAPDSRLGAYCRTTLHCSLRTSRICQLLLSTRIIPVRVEWLRYRSLSSMHRAWQMWWQPARARLLWMEYRELLQDAEASLGVKSYDSGIYSAHRSS